MLSIGGHTFGSRLLVGTGKFSSAEVMKEAIEASGSEMVTVALRRVDLDDPGDDIMSVLDRDRYVFLPNTSGARDADEAVRLARMAIRLGVRAPYAELALARSDLPREVGEELRAAITRRDT